MNLFSCGNALGKKYRLFSDMSSCEISRNGTVIAVGTRFNRQRLGHLCIKQTRTILHKQKIKFADNQDCFCDACALGKMHRLSFINSSTKAERVAELIHTDVCGPIQESSIDGSRYFLLFKDDFSHFRTV